MQGFEFADIIIIAMFAGFIILRLRSVLGRRTGNERPPPGDAASRNPDPQKNNGDIQTLPGAGHAADMAEDNILRFDANPAVRDGLRAISRTDSGFDPNQFLAGAKSAYEMILNAFWDGRLEDVKPYLGADVLSGFEGAVRSREAAGQQVENRILEVTRSEIIEAGMNGRIAEIAVRFVSDIIAVTRDAEGRVVEGDESDSIEIDYIWTFARDSRNRDPNWALVKTRVG